MIKVPVHNREGRVVDYLELNEGVLGGEVRLELLREVVLMYEASKRQGTASTKTRSEVRGSTRKPWRQKGTGLARAGSRRSPLWRGGAVVFGPKPRDYSYYLPKRMRRLATMSALLSKFLDREVRLVDEFHLEEPRTKEVAQLLRNLKVDSSCLIGVREADPVLYRSARNIPKVEVIPVKDMCAYDILKSRYLLLTVESYEALIGRFRDGS